MVNNNVLSITNLKKLYEDKVVLDGVSFKVLSSSIFGLLGLNGVGKTTIIKAIIGLVNYENQGDGCVELFGSSSEIFEHKKNIFYLPERFQPAKYLSGWEFIDIGLRFYNLKLTDQVRKEILNIAEFVELNTESLSKPIATYSKGMCQKLGLILANKTMSKLLILDEPMSGLDPIARVKLKQILVKYKKEFGGSIMLSSHLLNDIDEICDSIAVLHDKKIIFNGAPHDLKSKFNNSTLEEAFLRSISSQTD